MELTDVKGVGKKAAEKLIEDGIATVEDLANADPQSVNENWVNSAKELLDSGEKPKPAKPKKGDRKKFVNRSSMTIVISSISLAPTEVSRSLYISQANHIKKMNQKFFDSGAIEMIDA